MALASQSTEKAKSPTLRTTLRHTHAPPETSKVCSISTPESSSRHRIFTHPAPSETSTAQKSISRHFPALLTFRNAGPNQPRPDTGTEQNGTSWSSEYEAGPRRSDDGGRPCVSTVGPKCRQTGALPSTVSQARDAVPVCKAKVRDITQPLPSATWLRPALHGPTEPKHLQVQARHHRTSTYCADRHPARACRHRSRSRRSQDRACSSPQQTAAWGLRSSC